MTIKINFDATGNPEEVTLVLAKKNGDKLGKVNAKSIEISSSLNEPDEITFNVYKYIDGKKDPLWDLTKNFKLIWCPEMDEWFEATVEVDESNETVKTVFATQLGHAELSQIMLYDIAINTDGGDGDIARDDYLIPTVLYRKDEYDITENDKKFYKEVFKKDLEIPFKDYKDASLLHRILRDKAPHYSVAHVDSTISHMQRMFDFDDTSIYDALQEIAEELNCLFIFDAYIDEDGILRRTISAYDLESNCKSCGYRGEFMDICPECGESDYKNIDDGYGEDTTIFVTSDELADDIQLTTDVESIKNCFKLEGGDDLMTATIKNCNPNGSDYLFYLSSDMKADMSTELVEKISEYDKLYERYQSAKIYLDETPVFVPSLEMEIEEVDKLPETGSVGDVYIFEGSIYVWVEDEWKKSNLIEQYNDIVEKYNILMNREGDDALETIESPIKGFPALIDAYYNTFDMYLYLQSGLMPTIDTARPSIDEEIAELTTANLSPVAVNVSSTSSNPLKAASVSTVDNLVLQMAKTLVDSRYKVKIDDGSTLSAYAEGSSERIWTGKIILTAYSDDEVTAATDKIEVVVNDDYETFVRRKLDKALSAGDTEDMSVSGLFKKNLITDLEECQTEEDSFEYALKEYSLNRLTSFQDACQNCIDIMIEMGVADGKTLGNVESADLYNELYMVYYNKLAAITMEIAVRDSEIAIVAGVYDEDGNLVTAGLQTLIEYKKAEIQDALNFEKFLGDSTAELKTFDGASLIDSDGASLCVSDHEKSLWLEFCSFRREDKYSNDNYISEGKNNAEIIDLAKQFIETAKKEIYKSAERQHSISAGLKNLLVIKKFEPLVKHFRVGNWLRVMIDDQVYRLRLINYEIDYDKLDGISVEFSDTVKANSSIKSVKDVLEQASSMATSYSSVQRQASKGEESKTVINDWFSSGLDATNVKIMGGADGQSQTWDNHGMLFREYDESTGEYSPEQMKIINSTMAITTDNWNTTKTAVGKYYHADPDTGEMKMAYGINAETIVGKFILGENMSMRNESGSMVFDGDGLSITSGTGDDTGTMTFNEDGLVVQHGTNKVTISPKTEEVMNITNGEENVFQVNENGELSITGKIMARSLDLANGVEIDSGVITDLATVATSGSYTDLIDHDELAKAKDLAVYAKTDDLSDVAITGNYNDLSNKPTIPTVPTTATSVTSSGTTPVSGSAVYNYAVAKNQGAAKAGTLLYVGDDGNVTTLTIDGLKELLGIQ